MKLELRDDKHCWITFGRASIQHEVIIDQEKQDVRARFNNDIVKMIYDDKGLKAILVADKYVYQRP